MCSLWTVDLLLKKATCNVLFVLCLFLASSSDQCPLGLVEDPSAQYCEGKAQLC